MDQSNSKLNEKLLDKDQEMESFSAEPTPKKVVLVPTPQKTRGDSNKIETPKPVSNPEQKESYTISDTPSRFVCAIYEGLSNMESKNKATVGRGYILISSLIFTGLCFIKAEFLPHLPSLEVIFVLFLVSFVLNYYLLNGALYKPFLDNEDNSFSIKLVGGYITAAIAIFYYSHQFISITTSISILYFGLIVVILLEMLVLRQPFGKNQILLAVGSWLGAVITLKTCDYFTETMTPESENFVWGLILSLICAVLIGLSMMELGKMYSENFTSMNHIFTMMIVLFLPVFFPIQGVVKPSLGDWGLLVVMGIACQIALLSMMRGLQMEHPGHVSLFYIIQPPVGFLIAWVLGETGGFVPLLGVVMTIACLVFFSTETRERIVVRHTFIAKEGKVPEEEMREIA